MAFPNLKAEMSRKNLARYELANLLNMTPQNLNMKLSGKVRFSLDECKQIRECYFPDLTIDYLFADDGSLEPANTLARESSEYSKDCSLPIDKEQHPSIATP